MIYQILRAPLLILFFFYYRRIYFSGRSNLPKDAITLIASNHSTAFMEQILVAALQWRSVFFWAGAGSFDKSRIFPFLFRQMHVVPVWRQQEGIKKIAKNKQIFEDSKCILLKKNLFFITPEGESTSMKRLLAFKTGTARLAFMTATANDFEKDVFILPAGVNYTYNKKYRSEVMISFGVPLNVKNYKSLYLENPSEAVRKLTDDLKRTIGKEIVQINSPEDDEVVEQFLCIFRNEDKYYYNKKYSYSSKRLKMEQSVANLFNSLNNEKKDSLKVMAKSYHKKLELYQIKDREIQQNGTFNLIQVIIAFAFIPLSLFGSAGAIIPVNSARYLRKKTIKNIQFWAPMAVVYSFITWLLYSLTLVVSAVFFIGFKAFLIPPMLIVLYYISIINQESVKMLLSQIKYNRWKKKNKDLSLLLEEQRRNLLLGFKNEQKKLPL
ncbi:1-acyl-sn-glycerol-3-phosphate acyltransferase [Aureispira]|nr:1-acyl-sn-glycerol-3-phosphate acyltransferase [Aureispira sp.]